MVQIIENKDGTKVYRNDCPLIDETVIVMKEQCCKTTAKDVSNAFENFLKCYDKFRKDNRLSTKIINPYEVLTSMTDKHGRICRQVKHFERNDAKEDWPIGLSSALTGYIVYATMLLEQYGIKTSEGMLQELEESIKQHSGKK